MFNTLTYLINLVSIPFSILPSLLHLDMPSLPGSDSRDVLVETIPSQLGLLATHYPVTPPALIECLPHPVLAQTPQTGLP